MSVDFSKYSITMLETVYGMKEIRIDLCDLY